MRTSVTTQAVAVRGEEGLALAAGRPGSFAVTVWGDTYGAPLVPIAAEERHCDSMGCIVASPSGFTLSLVNARTTEEEALIQGYARKSDISFGGGGGGGWWGGFAAAGGSGYSNTDIGQVIVLAYLDAYTKLVGQFGGLPDNASAAAPRAR